MSQKVRLAQQILYASKASKIAKASRLGITASAILSFMIFAISYYGEMVGNFTFAVERTSWTAGLSLMETLDGERESLLAAPNVDNADGMTSLCGTEYSDYRPGDNVCIPDDDTLTSTDGSNNGESYLSYTFYVVNAGTAKVDLSATLEIESASKGAEEAIRIRVIMDGIDDDDSDVTYAKVQTARGDSPSEPEPLTEPFFAPTQVMFQEFTGEEEGIFYLDPGEYIRVTVVLWFEGEDADHNLNIVGGGVRLTMTFEIIDWDKQY